MEDNDQNDEYKFAELDSLDNGPMDEIDSDLNHNPSNQTTYPPKKDVRRNALIVVGLIIAAMILYKLVGYMFSGQAQQVAATQTITPVIVQPTPTITPVDTTPVIQPTPTSNVNSELQQKVSAIEVGQQSVKSDISVISDQVNTVNSNVNNINNQVATLNNTIQNLTNQLAKQSEEITLLMARSQPKKVKTVVKQVTQPINYYIQAVIPGRAWLIGSNGSTLTVREGTRIAGYGVVKLIDSMQGRVLTSSGRTIKFSQDDS